MSEATTTLAAVAEAAASAATPAATTAPAPAPAPAPAAAQPAPATPAAAADVLSLAAGLELIGVAYPDMKTRLDPLAALAKDGCTEAAFSRALLEARVKDQAAEPTKPSGDNAINPAAGGGQAAVVDTAGIYADRAKVVAGE